jgi:AraC family transcriptional regulator
MNKAIDYIEDNLEKDISYDEVAKRALCSTYHFQRMFSFLLNVPLSEYIRRRRLTKAAFELQHSRDKIIDLSLKYGYESPDSFTRAFQNLHGVTPSAARNNGIALKAYPKISFHIAIKGDVEMKYRIEAMPAFSLFGKSITVSSGENLFEVLPAFGDEIWENGTHDKINELAGNEPGTLLHGVHFKFKEDGTRDYMFAWFKPDKEIPEEYTVLEVPAITFAVFEDYGEMPDQIAIHKIWSRVYSEWFPTSGYEQTTGPCMEKYVWLDDKHISYRNEVWIPVIKAK